MHKKCCVGEEEGQEGQLTINCFEIVYRENFFASTESPRYLRSFYLRFRVYAIELSAFQRNVTSNLPMFQVSLYANHFFKSLSIAYNEGYLYRQPSLFAHHFLQICLFTFQNQSKMSIFQWTLSLQIQDSRSKMTERIYRRQQGRPVHVPSLT